MKEREKEKKRKKREKERKANQNIQHKQPPSSSWPMAGDDFQGIGAWSPSSAPAKGFVSLSEATAMQRTPPGKLVPETMRGVGGYAALPLGSTLGVGGCLARWVPTDPFPSPLFVGDRSKEVKLRCAGTAPHRSLQPRTRPIRGALRSCDSSPSVDTQVPLCPLLSQVPHRTGSVARETHAFRLSCLSGDQIAKVQQS